MVGAMVGRVRNNGVLVEAEKRGEGAKADAVTPAAMECLLPRPASALFMDCSLAAQEALGQTRAALATAGGGVPWPDSLSLPTARLVGDLRSRQDRAETW